MIELTQKMELFYLFYSRWITIYKEGAIRKVSMDKYTQTKSWLKKLIRDLKICNINRLAYQKLLNDYAELHERKQRWIFIIN